MSLSPVQARLLANSGLFDKAIRDAIAAISAATPWLWNLSLARQRDRSRLVTRRKQRRQW